MFSSEGHGANGNQKNKGDALAHAANRIMLCASITCKIKIPTLTKTGLG
jgi:hypothetical protein